MEFIIFFLLTLLAEVLGTIGGFGSSVFFVSFAQFLYDFQSVLALTGVMHVFSNSSKLFLFWKSINWKLVIWLGISSILMAIVGAYVIRWIEFENIQWLLGVFLISFSTFFLFKPTYQIAATLANSIVGGGLAGFLAGYIGTGGVVRGVVLAAFNLERSIFVGTSAAIDFGVDLSRSVIYVEGGFFQRDHLYYLPLMFLAAFLGSYVGKRVLAKISQETFRKILLVLIFLIGCSLVVNEIYKLL